MAPAIRSLPLTFSYEMMTTIDAVDAMTIAVAVAIAMTVVIDMIATITIISDVTMTTMTNAVTDVMMINAITTRRRNIVTKIGTPLMIMMLQAPPPLLRQTPLKAVSHRKYEKLRWLQRSFC